jgi:hypothetical protein
MATLVLSTVGTVLGGPLGGAIGSLIGHSIDQQLFGPGPQRGPRLGDLTVQTSSYGTAIPRIHGTMRVAGSIVWATDLKESSTQSGAKGQPETIVYSYSVSMAVALSSRPVRSIKRIWADGKLLRGAAGDFKVPVTFRLLNGSEDQAVDPLIASVEGIAQTPACRGLALAVFEDLQLAEYGNRIPFLTFEVEADAAVPTVGSILADASGGAIQSSASAMVDGYAAHGASMAAAVEPLVEHFGVELFDDGQVLRSAAATAPLRLMADELGNDADGKAAARIERTQVPARSLPAALNLSYYDPERDFQTSQMAATMGEGGGPVHKVELPAVLSTGGAKALAEASLARRWAKRDRLRLRLRPEQLGLEPGNVVELPLTPKLWTVEKCMIERMVPVVDLCPRWSSVPPLPAEPGRQSPSPDEVAGPVSLALLDVPDDSTAAGPVIYLAAATAGGQRLGVPLELEASGTVSSISPPAAPSVLGVALSILGDGQPYVLDLLNSLDVELVSESGWLQSCDDEALVAGGNPRCGGERADPVRTRGLNRPAQVPAFATAPRPARERVVDRAA